MYGEYLKHLISFIVAPTEVVFIASPLAFDGLHDDIIFLLLDTCTREIAVAKWTWTTIAEHQICQYLPPSKFCAIQYVFIACLLWYKYLQVTIGLLTGCLF